MLSGAAALPGGRSRRGFARTVAASALPGLESASAPLAAAESLMNVRRSVDMRAPPGVKVSRDHQKMVRRRLARQPFRSFRAEAGTSTPAVIPRLRRRSALATLGMTAGAGRRL